MIDWNSQLRIRLATGTEGAEETASLIVFPLYGDTKLRLVQAIASRVGGIVVYFEAQKDGVPAKVVPVTNWRDGALRDGVISVATFIDAADRNGMPVVCYGADRRRWSVKVESMPSDVDAIDNQTDRALAGDGRAGSVEILEPNGIRTEF